MIGFRGLVGNDSLDEWLNYLADDVSESRALNNKEVARILSAAISLESLDLDVADYNSDAMERMFEGILEGCKFPKLVRLRLSLIPILEAKMAQF